MVNWYLGSSAFSFKDWVGVFYPADLDPRDYLKYYSRVFNAVEIDSTFYAIPRSEVVEHWGMETGEDFKICAKLPKIITHGRELVDVQEPMSAFLDVMRILKDKLGPILVQLPPSFNILKWENLKDFLGTLPKDVRFAIELRHRSWYNEKTEKLLREHNVAWVATEYKQLPRRIYCTADFLYIRWIGYHGRFQTFESEKIDVTQNLRWWWQNIQEHLSCVDTVYGFFNNVYAGFAPGTCNRFKEMFGFEVKPLTPPGQERLF